MEQDTWLTKGAKILSDVKEWRKAHPKATFVEIEDEVHRRMMQLEAQLLQDLAEESASRGMGKGNRGRSPKMPDLPGATPSPRSADTHLTRQWRSKRDLASHLWNLPELWGEFFPPSMRN